MARFIVTHKLPVVGTQDEIIEVGKATINALSNGAEWLKSWVVPADGRLFCEWEAAKEESIHAVLKESGFFPIEVIHPVVVIDPAWFKESVL